MWTSTRCRQIRCYYFNEALRSCRQTHKHTGCSVLQLLASHKFKQKCEWERRLRNEERQKWWKQWQPIPYLIIIIIPLKRNQLIFHEHPWQIYFTIIIIIITKRNTHTHNLLIIYRILTTEIHPFTDDVQITDIFDHTTVVVAKFIISSHENITAC